MSERSPAMPPLAALRAFEAAARLGSFTRAADELAMTQAAVSYQVKDLEARLGAALFRRAGRSVELTPAGRRLSAAATEAFGLLRNACAGIAHQRSSLLHITALPTFVSNWLAPRLGDFQLRHPAYAVRVDASASVEDLRASEFDVAIRSGDGDWLGCEAVRLFANEYTVVCSPELVATNQVAAPADLLKVPLFGTEGWWRTWFAAAGVPTETVRSTDLSTQGSEVTAALRQRGAAIVTPLFFAEEIREGSVSAPFPVMTRRADYWLVYRAGADKLPNVRDFKRWILEQCRAE